MSFDGVFGVGGQVGAFDGTNIFGLLVSPGSRARRVGEHERHALLRHEVRRRRCERGGSRHERLTRKQLGERRVTERRPRSPGRLDVGDRCGLRAMDLRLGRRVHDKRRRGRGGGDGCRRSRRRRRGGCSRRLLRRRIGQIRERDLRRRLGRRSRDLDDDRRRGRRGRRRRRWRARVGGRRARRRCGRRCSRRGRGRRAGRRDGRRRSRGCACRRLRGPDGRRRRARRGRPAVVGRRGARARARRGVGGCRRAGGRRGCSCGRASCRWTTPSRRRPKPTSRCCRSRTPPAQRASSRRRLRVARAQKPRRGRTESRAASPPTATVQDSS